MENLRKHFLKSYLDSVSILLNVLNAVLTEQYVKGLLSMKVNTKEFQDAFSIVDSVPVNAVMESSQNVQLKRDKNGIDLFMSGVLWAQAHIANTETGAWSAFVDRRILKTFINTASKDETEIFFAKDKLTLRSGQTVELANKNLITGYEKWAPKSVFELESDQKHMLRTAVKYLPKLPGTEHFNAVYFGKDVIISTDSLAMMFTIGSKVNPSFFMPPDIARFIATNPSKIGIDKNGVGAVSSHGNVFQPRSSSLDSYPVDKIQEHIEKASQSSVLTKFPADAFLDAIRAASQFLFESESAQIESGKNCITVSASSSLGKFSRSVKAGGTGKIPASVNIKPKLIVPWLEFASGFDSCEIEYIKTDDGSVFRFTEDSRCQGLIVSDI